MSEAVETKPSEMVSSPADGRDTGCDVLRIILSVFVVIIHSPDMPDKIWARLLFFSCNSLFFLMSGKFNLRRDFKEKDDYKRYYLTRSITIFFPFVLWVIVNGVLDLSFNHPGTPALSSLHYLFEYLMSLVSASSLWFMFPLIGMLLAAPFFAKLFHTMKNFELHLLCIITLVWVFFSVHVGADMGFGFAYSSFILVGAQVYFFLGYYLDRIDMKKSVALIMLIGGVISDYLLAKYLGPQGHYTADNFDALPYMAAIVGGYVLFTKCIKIKSKKAASVISFFAKNTYLIYLFHMGAMSWFALPLMEKLPFSFTGLSVILTYIGALIPSILLTYLVINPLKKFALRRAGLANA